MKKLLSLVKSRRRPMVLFLIWVITSCATPQLQTPVDRKTLVERTNALIIIGTTWQEYYNDPKSNEDKILKSPELLNNVVLLEENRTSSDKKLLKKPLHYLFNIKFIAELNNEEKVFTRYGKRVVEYEDFGIYQVSPGNFSLNEITLNKLVFKPSGTEKLHVRWQKYEEYFENNFGSWLIEPGKIYYLGDFKLYFRAKKKKFGFYPVENINISLKTEGIKYYSDYNQLIELFRKEKPWFPAKDIIDVSTSEKWFLGSPETVSLTIEKKNDGTDVDENKEFDEERDTKKYFY
jgi:hypothetical protein